MAFSQKSMVILVLAGVLFQFSMAAVYKVGDSKGWTTINPPDYSKWASGKTFHVGDTILFTYNAQYHNVMEVTHTAYSSCNATAPIATHTSGNDSITVKKTGHFYYLCGIPGHCQSGQKVDIRVVSTSTASSPSLAPSPSTSSSASSPSGTTPGSGAPGPATKNSATHLSNGFSGLMLAFAVAVFACFGF